MKVTFDEKEKDKIAAFESLPDALAKIEIIKDEVSRIEEANEQDNRSRINDIGELRGSIKELSKVYEDELPEITEKWRDKINSFAFNEIYERFKKEDKVIYDRLKKADELTKELEEKGVKLSERSDDLCNKADNANLSLNSSMVCAIVSTVFNLICVCVFLFVKVHVK